MVFKSFRFQIVLRGVGIGLSAWAFAWSIYLTDFLMTPIVFALVTILQMVALIAYCERALKEVKRFSDSFIDSDYSRKFDDHDRGKVFQDLGMAFNRIMEDFKQIRIEKEEHYRYLLQVNKHVNVGLICFKEDGHIDLMNTAAATLLNTPILDRMDHLKNHHEGFYSLLIGMRSGDKELFHSTMTEEARDLAIAANKFILKEQNYTLISLQDIRSELDAHEMTAWQKLIRVLTHEIMNSVTPVVSLTTAIKLMMEEGGKPKPLSELDEEAGADIYRSVMAIKNRGQGLLSFVNAYRDYTNPPEPELEEVNLHALATDALQVLKSEMGKVKVVLDERSDTTVLVEADPKLIGQVLINLLKNAREALRSVEDGCIVVTVTGNGGKGQISVADNGPGIPAELKDEIFVPFFSTKEKGSGIGLSLSRQIMKAHGGDLQLISSSQGASFHISLERKV